MSTLAEFLLARIAEDEALAWEAVCPVISTVNGVTERFLARWRAEEDGEDGWSLDLVDNHGEDMHSCVSCNDSGGNELSEAEARHIAANDPAFVLAECAALRAVVELHEGLHYCGSGWSRYDPGCQTLLALAQPYAAHPEFDPSWKVDA